MVPKRLSIVVRKHAAYDPTLKQAHAMFRFVEARTYSK